jgi:hypothetical protein
VAKPRPKAETAELEAVPVPDEGAGTPAGFEDVCLVDRAKPLQALGAALAIDTARGIYQSGAEPTTGHGHESCLFP